MPLSMPDRVAIEELIALHGHLTDDGDLDRYDEVFTDDVTYDLADFGLGELKGVDGTTSQTLSSRISAMVSPALARKGSASWPTAPPEA